VFKVAIRVPGARCGTRKTDVLEFRTFYGVLQAMGRELRSRGVTQVVMEASGIYTDPVYYALAELDFTEVMVVNPAHAKALKGHKTDPPRTRSGCWICMRAGCCAAPTCPARTCGRCGTWHATG
jgi:transposase